jgi:phasin family protein
MPFMVNLLLQCNINALQSCTIDLLTDSVRVQITKKSNQKEIDMNLTPEQIAAAQKANLETLSGLTNQALQSIEKLVELNMQIAKQSLSDSMNSAKKALEVKDIQQLLAHQAEAVQPMAEKIMAYSRHLYDLAHETQASFTKSAEKEFQDGQKKMNALVEDWTKNAPAGSDAAVQAMKQAIASANNVFETSQKAVKHAVEVAQSNMSSATDTVMKTAQTASKAAKKK